MIIDAFAFHTFSDQKWIAEAPANANIASDHSSEVKVDVSEDLQEGTNFRREIRKSFTEENHLLSVPTVKGFDLENRQWCELYIDGFSDIVWNESAFDKLVIDDGEKQMILAFSEQVRDAQARSDDFIKNKGKLRLTLTETLDADYTRPRCPYALVWCTRCWQNPHRRIYCRARSPPTLLGQCWGDR